MQVLIFHIGTARFALPTVSLRRLLPLLTLSPIPGAPAWVAGLMTFQGRAVPVVDLSALSSGQRAVAQLDTRILLMDYTTADGQIHPLGLIAEGVADTLNFDSASITDSGFTLPEAPYLGKIINSPAGPLQLISVKELLPPAVSALLFVHREGAA